MTTDSVPADAERIAKAGATLQAVLQSSDGGMDTMAVPVPLPEVIIRVDASAVSGAGDDRSRAAERWFRRNRSSDSVVRYVEEEVTDDQGVRTCSHCGASHSLYFLSKPAADALPDAKPAAFCEICYGRGASAS